MTLGTEFITAERRRQIEYEGYDAEHDDDFHTTDELLLAARCYIAQTMEELDPHRLDVPDMWPWERADWKPSEDPIRNLVKAGALIAAEIDRRIREINHRNND